MPEPVDPRDYTLQELREFFLTKGLPAFRGNQLFVFMHKRRCRDFADLTTFSKALRRQMGQWFHFSPVGIAQRQQGQDGTVKFLCSLADKEQVESVLLFNRDRPTACISTQVGCRFGCAFCRTARLGFVRDLQVHEMVEQFARMNDWLKEQGKHIRNLVFMGMGEPMDNLDRVLKAAHILSAAGGYELSQRRMTISTCGHVPGIWRLARLRAPQLAVSLNAPSQKKRQQLMPCARKWPLDELMAALRAFFSQRQERVTLEYIMIKDVNDSPADAQALIALLKPARAFKVNLIPLNPCESFNHQAPAMGRIEDFQAQLKAKRISTHVRQTRGDDILAACGQLTAGR